MLDKSVFNKICRKIRFKMANFCYVNDSVCDIWFGTHVLFVLVQITLVQYTPVQGFNTLLFNTLCWFSYYRFWEHIECLDKYAPKIFSNQLLIPPFTWHNLRNLSSSTWKFVPHLTPPYAVYYWLCISFQLKLFKFKQNYLNLDKSCYVL